MIAGRFEGTLRVLLPWAVIAGLWLAFMAFLLNGTDTRVGRLLRDPAELKSFWPLTGFFSLIGLMLWAAGAGACIVAALVARARGDTRVTIYMAATAVFALGAAFDDAFLLHEAVIPRRLGVGEDVVLGVYAVVAVGWYVAFRRLVPPSSAVLLVLAVGALAASVVLDVIYTRQLFEDMAKYVGVGTFAAFCVKEATRCILEVGPVVPARRVAVDAAAG
ncbi:MAG TPA: hypothetical protein VM573_09305 [Actinomycetota bacterium]|nr:hypothetical protein [Actinomycetota bacterium]